VLHVELLWRTRVKKLCALVTDFLRLYSCADAPSSSVTIVLSFFCTEFLMVSRLLVSIDG
jgi:hypothetical protein